MSLEARRHHEEHTWRKYSQIHVSYCVVRETVSGDRTVTPSWFQSTHQVISMSSLTEVYRGCLVFLPMSGIESVLLCPLQRKTRTRQDISLYNEHYALCRTTERSQRKLQDSMNLCWTMCAYIEASGPAVSGGGEMGSSSSPVHSSLSSVTEQHQTVRISPAYSVRTNMNGRKLTAFC